MLVRLKVPRIWTIDAGNLLLLVLGETDLVVVPLDPKEVGGIGPTGGKIHEEIVIVQTVEHLLGRDNNTTMCKCLGVKGHIGILHNIHHILQNCLHVNACQHHLDLVRRGHQHGDQQKDENGHRFVFSICKMTERYTGARGKK